VLPWRLPGRTGPALASATCPSEESTIRRLFALIALLGLTLGPSPAVRAQDATPSASPAAGCQSTTAAENAATARRWYDEALNQGHLDVLDEFVAPDLVHDAGVFPGLEDRDALKQALAALLTAFPDIQFSVDAVVAGDDLVAIRWTGRGTHNGPFRGIDPTGQPVTFTGINIFRFACGRIVQGWSEADGVGILQQINALPTPATPAASASPAVAPAAATPAASCPSSGQDENTAVAQRWFTDAVNPNRLDALDLLLTDDFVLHAATFPDAHGSTGAKQLFGALFTGFPDLRFTVGPTVAEGDLVVEQWTAQGTHQGPFQGIAPTGRQATWTGINIYRIACGRIAEVWTETDGLGRLQQLGALPPLATPAP
jgi:steroid delta-isomerase-like uncharacterized protein